MAYQFLSIISQPRILLCSIIFDICSIISKPQIQFRTLLFIKPCYLINISTKTKDLRKMEICELTRSKCNSPDNNSKSSSQEEIWVFLYKSNKFTLITVFTTLIKKRIIVWKIRIRNFLVLVSEPTHMKCWVPQQQRDFQSVAYFGKQIWLFFNNSNLVPSNMKLFK